MSDRTEARAREHVRGADAFAPGTVIDGKFRIDGIIGVGGMGTVLAAHHIGLDKAVALKVLVDQGGDRSAIQRLIREARAVAQLESAGVARVLDVGATSGGAPYIVMERLVGMDFGALLHIRGTLKVYEAARYIIEACAPLEEAHGVGIVHRDLKPQNLFLAETKPGRKVVKVLDFGISRMDPGPAHSLGSERLTAQHELLGTPRYMPPEQIGGARHADARSDVYSLGGCLYHFVSGTPPIANGSLFSVLNAIRTEVPPRLDTLRSDVPRGFADVVARCLAKSPADRLPSIQALRDALTPFAIAPSASSGSGSEHLEDATVLAMQERALTPGALRHAQLHLASCGECRELVAFAAVSAREGTGSATLSAADTEKAFVGSDAPSTTLVPDTRADPTLPDAGRASGATLASAQESAPLPGNGGPATLASPQEGRVGASSNATFQPAIVSVEATPIRPRSPARRALWLRVSAGVVVAATVATLVAARSRAVAQRVDDANEGPRTAVASGAFGAPGPLASIVVSPTAAPSPAPAASTSATAARTTTRAPARRPTSAGVPKSTSTDPLGAGIPDER